MALHVKSTTDVEQIKVENTASSGRAQVRYVNPHGDWVTGIIGGTTDGDFITYTAAAKNFRVYTGNTEKFRITSTGHTKIDSQVNALTDLSTSINYHLHLSNPNNDLGEAVGICFGLSTGGDVGASIYHTRSGGTSYGDLMFATKPSSGGAVTERLRITAAGKVGIGQDTPTEIFHIKQDDAVGPSITLENNNSGDKCWINNWGSTGGGSGRQNKFEINASAVGSLALASAYISLQAGGAGDSYERVRITTAALLPGTDNNLDLGSSSKRWQNIYTGDLQLSNVTPSVSANGENLTPSGNEVDGTEGTWTIQEGLNDLFLINRINGKKYKFNLTEIS